jgi:hypothetical protein
VQNGRQLIGTPRRVALRRVVVALTALLLSFAFVSGLARPQGRYFYCEAMGLLASDPCAAAARSDHTRDVSSDPEASRTLWWLKSHRGAAESTRSASAIRS